MENLGTLAILLAFCFACYAVIGSVAGKLGRRPFLILSAERAVYCVWVLLTVAASLLVYSLIAGDFRLAYVAEHSNKSMDTPYKFASWWGGQEGSLLLWSWLLATYTSVLVFQNRRKFREMMPYVTAVLMTTEAFFLTLISFPEAPFKVLMAGKGVVDAGDGNGLNPLLQYWTMVIHPPILYLGYVGFAVPFAFAMGSLITKQRGEAWIHTTRRWTLVTWMFQTTGILLGAGWAYAVLGWGGYWAWDPVENASFLPWLTATAFIHSTMVQQRKRMLRAWTMTLALATFLLTLLGTFMTRSGVFNSVHSFTQSDIGPTFLVFIGIVLFGSLALLAVRGPVLAAQEGMQSGLSREATILVNNLLFVAITFTVLLGTLWPIVSDALRGVRVSVGEPYFNSMAVPGGLAVLFLMGVGPALPWGASQPRDAVRQVGVPAGIGALVMALCAAFGLRGTAPLLTFGLAGFALSVTLRELFLPARVRMAEKKESALVALVRSAQRARRRFGGYIVHVGVIAVFVGVAASSAYKQHLTGTLRVGEDKKLSLGGYTLALTGIENGREPHRTFTATRMVITAP